MSSRIAGNYRLGLGSSKIEVLAKNSKKNQGKLMIVLVVPACGVGFLTSLHFGSPNLGVCGAIVLNNFQKNLATTLVRYGQKS